MKIAIIERDHVIDVLSVKSEKDLVEYLQRKFNTAKYRIAGRDKSLIYIEVERQ